MILDFDFELEEYRAGFRASFCFLVLDMVVVEDEWFCCSSKKKKTRGCGSADRPRKNIEYFLLLFGCLDITA